MNTTCISSISGQNPHGPHSRAFIRVLLSFSFFLSLILSLHLTSVPSRTPRPPSRLAKTLTITGFVMMWIMWSCIYMAQMYPLVQPLLNA